MNDLATYLNDHLAGSVGALEMLQDMIDKHKDDQIGSFLMRLHRDIESDQQELKRFMKHLEADESGLRKVSAWVAEKFSRGKLGAGDSSKPNLALLQSLEIISLGIMGKRLLWRTLDSVAEVAPRLRGFDFARLEQLALDQFERVQKQSLKIALQIFSPKAGAPPTK